MAMNNFLQQAQRLQKELLKKQEEFFKKEFAFDYGNGAIIITILGSSEIKNITIKKELIDPEDAITLQEMIAEAINSAYRQVKAKFDDITSQTMPSNFGGGLF